MTDIYVAERALDMAPMIDALKYQPSDFELNRGWLLHVPSRHRYRFERGGMVTIDAHCGCAALRARPDQQADLAAAYNDWRVGYWAVVETNREFAGHFAPVGRLRRFARDVRIAFRRMMRGTGRESAAAVVLAPAE
jgi:hypothetical protein